jgi:hypothetical protein
VRSLGRSAGKGPKRRAPEAVYASKRPPGVIRSALVPEEVRGLCKAGNLTQMLPSEAALLAVGWPREQNESDEEAVQERGSHPARLLFLARLAEKSLLSYQRVGAFCRLRISVQRCSWLLFDGRCIGTLVQR